MNFLHFPHALDQEVLPRDLERLWELIDFLVLFECSILGDL